MDLNNIILISILGIFSLFFYKYFLQILNKYNPKLLIDDQFEKPQAFHEKGISVAGGACIFFSLLIIFFNLYISKNIFFLEHLSFCSFFFLLGFLDDIKININPTARLIFMIIFLIMLVKINNFYLYKTGIEFLNNWINNSNIFSLIFICLCFLFTINGANLIDGYNGLLGIHALIIIFNLCLLNFFYDNNDLAQLLFFSLLVIIFFLILNFPKGKVFLGDSGSYLLGALISVSVVKTSIAIPEISPFYFCIILFYLFFEVFFSFFRKLLKEKKSPIHPDEKHLHMLLYKFLLKKNGDKVKSNYQVSIIINLIYLVLIIPSILMMENGIFCKYYSLVFFIFYFFSYKLVSEKT